MITRITLRSGSQVEPLKAFKAGKHIMIVCRIFFRGGGEPTVNTIHFKGLARGDWEREIPGLPELLAEQTVNKLIKN